jgi:uncharacterized protein (DUF58 family)
VPFNLLPRKGPDRAASSAKVYTSVDALARLQAQATGYTFLPRQPVHSLLVGRHASRLRGRGLSFDEIRQYRPGDDIRNMDWKVTARMREPHVRVFTEERDRPVLLVVDQRQNMFFGSRRCMKSVAAAETVALAAWRVLASGDRVGALVFNDTDTVEIRPHRSRQRVMRILDAVVTMNHELDTASAGKSNPARLNEVLREARRVATHDHLVIVITDGNGVDEDTLRETLLISTHNDVIWVRIFDPLEAELPDVGAVIVGRGDAMLQVDTSDRRLRDGFRDAFAAQMDSAHGRALKASIPHLPIHTAEDVATQVRRILGEPTRAG